MGKEKYSKHQIKHIEFVKNKLAKAVNNFNMISPGDKILVAISGGKDSLVLLETLASFKKFKTIDFEFEAIHINLEDVSYEVNHDYLINLCESIGIKMNFVDTKAGIEERAKKSACFVCSWKRRTELFSYAHENGFNKLALGHHMDDAVETLLINMTYHANISSLPGTFSMFEDKLVLIRPLILLTNKDTAEFANIKKYPKLKAECPFEDATRRKTARDLIKQLEVIHPNVRQNLFNSLTNIDFDHLPKETE